MIKMNEEKTIVYWYNKDTKEYTIDYKEMQKINRKLKERFTLKQENKQLQNNWNELKKWLEEQKEFINDIPTFSNDIKNNHIGMVGAYNNSLDKMQELQGDDKN